MGEYAIFNVWCQSIVVFAAHPSEGMILCDILPVLVHVYPQLMTESHSYPVSMEVTGSQTRGQLVVGQYGPYDQWVGTRGVRFVERLNINNTIDILNEMFSK